MFNNAQQEGFPGQGPENFGSFNDDFVFGEEEGGNFGQQGDCQSKGPTVPCGTGSHPVCDSGKWRCERSQPSQKGCQGNQPQCAEGQYPACESNGWQCRERAGGDRSKNMRDYTENFARDCRAKGGRWDCGYSNIDPSNPCRCFIDERREEFRPPEQQRPPEGQQYQQPPTDFRPPEGQQQPPTTTQPPSSDGSATTDGTSAGTSTSTGTTTGTSTGTSTDTSTSTSSGSSSSSTSDSTSSSTSSGGGGSTSESSSATTAPTGGVITGNAFLEYYFD